MKNSYQQRIVLGSVLSLVCAIGLGIAAQQWWAKLSSRESYSFYGTVLNKPRPLPVFTLEGTEGYAIDNRHLQGHWTFLFMGFTHCASICPVTMAELAKMAHLMSQQPDLSRPTVIGITTPGNRTVFLKGRIDRVSGVCSLFISSSSSCDISGKNSVSSFINGSVRLKSKLS
ncbi:MAG: hypothetical protein EBY22_09305 [Gammaproteobacteria bacterium]|nr:hypothetical protein [Gammaproteobacteria bacterium]